MFANEQLAKEGFADVGRQGSVVAQVDAASQLASMTHKTASENLSCGIEGLKCEPESRHETAISLALVWPPSAREPKPIP